jgi:hypothetical protein
VLPLHVLLFGAWIAQLMVAMKLRKRLVSEQRQQLPKKFKWEK